MKNIFCDSSPKHKTNPMNKLFMKNNIALKAFFLFFNTSVHFFVSPFLTGKRHCLRWKKTIVINNDKFKVYNNWLSAGGGEVDNFTRYGYQFTLGADYNFHIQAKYFQIGFCFSGADLNDFNDFNYHLAFGGRKETTKYNLAYFIGPAYSTGYKKVDGYFTPDEIYNQIGLYGCIQFIKKISYDVGIGPSLFFDLNKISEHGGNQT